MNAPAFRHAPPSNGRYQMLAYSSSDPVRAMEYYIPAKNDAAAIRSAKFEADYACRKYVIVRNGAGRVLYDGPVRDADAAAHRAKVAA